MSTLSIGSDPQRRRAFRMLVASEVKIARRRPIVAIIALIYIKVFGASAPGTGK